MSNKISQIRCVNDEKDIIIQNFKHTINNLTNIITNSVNKMSELNEYRKKEDIVSYTETDIDNIKSNHNKIITDMNNKFNKINLAYNAVNNVYSRYVKNTAITDNAYKTKIDSLENKLYTIKNTHREELLDLQSFYKKKIDYLNNSVNNLEKSIRLLKIKNKQARNPDEISCSDYNITNENSEKLVNSTIDSLDDDLDEDYKLDELILDSDSDNKPDDTVQ